MSLLRKGEAVNWYVVFLPKPESSRSTSLGFMIAEQAKHKTPHAKHEK